MNTHRLKVGAATVITLGAVTVFGVTLVHSTIYAPESSSSMASAFGTSSAPYGASSMSTFTNTEFSQASTSLPAKLIIPTIGVNASVQYAGVTPKGNMGTPSNFTDVVWYQYGTIPGHIGSAVIDGHVDNGLSLAGVFKRLDELVPGDDIYVESKDGSRLHFVMQDIRSYDSRSIPTDLIFNQNDKAYLKLITCSGDWLESARSYDHRLVVTAIYHRE